MVDAVLDVAVHEGRQVVDRVVDAVVGDAPLRVVVGADLGRTVARRNHRLALRGDFVEVFRIFEVEDAGAKFFESLVEVLELRFLVLALHDDTGRDVRQADRRVGPLSGSSIVIRFFKVEMFTFTSHVKLRVSKIFTLKSISTPLLTMLPTLSI